MANVLYEVQFSFDPFFLIPLFMLAAFVAFPFLAERFGGPLTAKAKGIMRTVCAVFAGCILLISAFVVSSQVHMYHKTAGAYKAGDYRTVEGYVENFDPLLVYERGKESFDLSGVHFAYSQGEARTGYHTTQPNGGVITGNGQHLKIGYVYYNSTYGNIIVYIEQLP